MKNTKRDIVDSLESGPDEPGAVPESGARLSAKRAPPTARRLRSNTLHELRSRLNTIIGLATLMRDGVELGHMSQIDALRKIVDAGWALDKKIRDLRYGELDPEVPVTAESTGDRCDAREGHSQHAEPDGRGAGEGRRVLVVDDLPTNRLLLSDTLGAAGFEVVVEAGGEAGLLRAPTCQPSLIVLDIHMPGLDGIETCRRLKANPATADVPVLFLTAEPDEETTLAALHAGGSDFIERQISPAILIARASALIAAFETRQRLRDVAMTDELTGLYSRRYFFEALRQHATRAARGDGESMVSCLMIDVDRFKAINDRFGHLAGDNALRLIADVVRASLRGGDIAARFGGDEIAVLLPATSHAGAVSTAEKIRTEVERVIGSGRPVTVSIGVACESLAPNRAPRSDELAESLLRRADAALYDAKDRGRNQTAAV